MLENYISDKKTIILANNAEIEAFGYGNIQIQVYNEKTSQYTDITINKVYYSPEITTNLLSIKRIIEKSWNLIANKNYTAIQNSSISLKAHWKNDLYQLNFKIPKEDQLFIAKNSKITPNLIHERLGHINKEYF